MPGKSVCIVGGGLSGLTSIKECLAHGLKPACYELDSYLGGLWRPEDNKSKKMGVSLWSNFLSNFSKWGIAFSDLPPDPKDPLYLTKEAMSDYYQRFAKRFDLVRYMQFNTRVVWIRKSPDHGANGRWEVFTCPTSDFPAGNQERDNNLSHCKKEIFDFVIICSGYYNVQRYPVIPGVSTFNGNVNHSFNYKGPENYKEKNVLVVGNGISAMEITDDIAAVAKQTYLAVGDGTWSTSRPREQSMSRDVIHRKLYSRINFFKLTGRNKLDQRALGIAALQVPSLLPRAITNGLWKKLMSEGVTVFGHLSKITSSEAHFRDGNVISGLDEILFCTGYKANISFLDANIVAPDGKMELYKMTFPVTEDHHTLALVGVQGLNSPYAIVSELQSRLVTRVMAGLHSLPSQEDMRKDANIWNQFNWQRKGNYNYHLPGYILSDSIASVLGVYPSIWKIALRDPLLAYRIWHGGGAMGAHYRLVGPDSQWEQAKRFCHQQYSEGKQNVLLRQCQTSENSSQKILLRGEDPDTIISAPSQRLWKIISLSVFVGAFALIFANLKTMLSITTGLH